ncbi:hypothetical protein [Vagococcus sp. WN89Y]|uniref:hypothetical protein n=1 Tax=Vagococcus sp. WN89Y TaxID=3457258 RepID=UPI003FCD7C01
MPNMLPVERDYIQPASHPEPPRRDYHPLVMKELSSVTHSAVNRTPQHWLTRFFSPRTQPALPEKMALAQCLEAQTAEAAPSHLWLKAGVALTLFSAAGALAWGMTRRLTANEEASNNNTAPALPQPAALADSLTHSFAGTRAIAAARQRERTAMVEAIRDDLLIRFPGIRGVAPDQLLITPLLEMLIASAGGRDMDKAALAQQLTRLVNVTLSTLSIREHLQLYRRERTAEDNAPLALRFTAQDGQGYVPLYQHEYPLKVRPDGTPYITDAKGRCFFIRYNQRTGSWEYVNEADNQGYSAQARDFNQRYRLRLINLPDKFTMDYYPEQDCAGITSSGWIHTRGLFIAGNFLPVWSPGNVKGETYINRGDEYTHQRHLLVRGDYGWAFERPSARMDAYLNALLSSADKGKNNDFEKAIGAIHEADEQCIDRAGRRWLKKDNQYFRAQCVKGTGQTITLIDYAGARAEYKNGVMLLQSAEEMIFALDTASVSNTVISSGPFMIEAAALDYLQKKALTTQAKPLEDLRDYHPGLAEDDDYSTMLVINDRKYAVREYGGGYIRVENKHNPYHRQQDIVLWLAGNTLLRVRNTPTTIPYTVLNTKYFNKPDNIETKLYQKLNDYIDTGRALSLPAERKKLIQPDKLALPAIWLDAQANKHYFLYNGNYFPATLSDANDRDNPTGLSRVNVFACESFYSQQELIASLVMEKKTDHVEIKTPASLLAEKLHISKGIAALYCDHQEWSKFSDMTSVAQAASAVLATGKFSVVPPGIVPLKQDLIWGNTGHAAQIKNRLYPPRVSETRLELFRLTDDHLPPGRQKIQRAINGTLHLIKQQMLPLLIESIRYDTPTWPVLQPYLHQVLPEANDELLSAISVEWCDRLRMIDSWLRAENIYLLGGENIYLRQEEKHHGNSVFMAPSSSIFYINTHKINLEDKAQLRLATELFSASINIADVECAFSSLRQNNGIFPPVGDTRRAMVDILKQNQLTPDQQHSIQMISKKYLQSVPPYNSETETLLKPEKLAYLAKYDPAYRAHLFVNTPSLLSLLSLDSYFLLATSGRHFAGAEEWLKHYGALRASDITLPVAQTTSTTTETSTPSATTLALETHHHWHLPDHPHGPHKQPRQEPANSETRPANTQQQGQSSDTRSNGEPVSGPGEGKGTKADKPIDSPQSSENQTQETSEEVEEESSEETDQKRKEDSSDESKQIREDNSPDEQQKPEEKSPDEQKVPEENSPDEPQVPEDNTPDEQEIPEDNSPDERQIPEETSPQKPPSKPGSPLPAPLPLPPGPPLLPVPPAPPIPAPPPVIPDLNSQIAGYGAIAGAGIGIGLGIPDVNTTTSTTMPQQNTSTTFPAPSSLTAISSETTPLPTDVHMHREGAKFFVKPEAQDKNKGERFEPDSRDDVFLPGAQTSQTREPSPETRVYVPGRGNVIRVEIPELSCLGEKDLTLAEELRYIGQALQSPITASALARQETEYIDIRGGDCPTAEEAWWLEDRTTAFDAIVDLIMMMAPQLRLLYIFRMIVGPLLLMIADDLEGKEITLKDRFYYFLNAAMQVMSIFNVKVPTLKGTARSSIFRKSGSKITRGNSGSASFDTRFSYIRNNEIYVKVEGEEYPLQTSYDEEPMVQNEKGQSRIIKFNQQEDRWYFDEDIDQEVRDENKRNQNKFKLPLAELPDDVVIEAENNEMFTIKINGRDDITGVFTDMEFIPARLEYIGAEAVAYTTSELMPQQEQRLLIHDESGWDFERKSAKMDQYFEILLTNKKEKSFFPQNSFGAIRKIDGVSHDIFGDAFIKKDYKYYRVEKLNRQSEDIIYKLPDYEGGVVRYKNGYFILEGGTDILFPAKTELIREKETAFRIEADVLPILHSKALFADASFPERIAPGLYSTPDRSASAFIINQEQFAVRFHTDREMHIIRKDTDNAGSDIKLWLDKNTWFRIREEVEETLYKYENIASCRVARTPGGGSSCPGANIMIESGLSKKLVQDVHDGMALDTVPERERLVETRTGDIPFLYQDKVTKKYYFKYSNNYFNARIIETKDTGENPTGFPCIRVTGRSDFYRAEKNVATIVMYDDSNSIKMVDLSTFIAEKLKVSPEEAVIYNKKTLFHDMEYIELLEKLTNEAQISENTYVEQPIEITTVPEFSLSGAALDDAAKKTLFSQQVLKNNQYSIHIYGLNTPAAQSSPYVQDSIRFVKRSLDYLRQTMLPRVMNSLRISHYNHPITEDYLTEIMKKSDTDFIRKVELSLFSRLVNAKDEINYRIIKLMTVVDDVNHQHPLYTRTTDSAVFIGDKEHIYINIDLLDIGENAKLTDTHDLTGAILTAALGATGKASHIVDIPRKNGIFINIKDAYRSIQNTVKSSTTRAENIPRMREVILRYLKNSPLYRSHIEKLIDMPVDWRKFSYMLRFDPGLRAQITLNSDELLTLMTQDIHYLISSSEQEMSILHPWVKKYGKNRGIVKSTAEKVQITDAMTSATVDVGSLTAFSAEETITRELPGNKYIYSTTEGKMLFKWHNKYYPVEFIGPSGMLVSIGSFSEIRQVYYYDPVTGELSPVQQPFARSNVLTYDSDMDVYVSTAPAADYSAILKFDKDNDLLILTGANRITHLPGRITRVEYPWFNLYHPEGASHDVYIHGHGKILKTKTTLPDNIKVLYYTHKNGQLIPYKGDIEGLLSSRFVPREENNPGDETEDYLITPMSHEYVNYYHMARRYNKNIIQLRSKSTLSATIIEAAARLFTDDEVNIHLYIGRATDEQRMLPVAPGRGTPSLNSEFTQYKPPAAHWAFDQQVNGGAVQPDRVLKGFIPLKETHVYLHYGTVDTMAKGCIDFFLKQEPYEIFYGLDIDGEASIHTPVYIKNIRVQAARNIEKAKSSLDTAWVKLNTPTYQQSIYDYFTFAFDMTDEDVLNQIVARFKTHTSRVRNFIIESSQRDYENIAVVSTKQIEDPRFPGLYKSAMASSEHLQYVPAAFIIPGDAYRRVFLMGDSYPQMEVNRKSFDRNEMMLEHILTHESSHIAADTFDITYIAPEEIDYTDGGLNIQDAQRGLRQINHLLESSDIKSSVLWGDYVPTIYRYLGIEQPTDANEVMDMIKKSPMLKANLIMSNADSFAVFVKHVANLDTDGRYKREVEESVREADYKHLGLLFAAAREHHIIDLE